MYNITLYILHYYIYNNVHKPYSESSKTLTRWIHLCNQLETQYCLYYTPLQTTASCPDF